MVSCVILLTVAGGWVTPNESPTSPLTIWSLEALTGTAQRSGSSFPLGVGLV